MSFTYAELFDIARMVVALKTPAVVYRDGVERAAALAGVAAPTEDAAICAMERVFENYLLTPSAWVDPVI